MPLPPHLTPQPPNHLIPFLSFILLIALLLALGRNTPIFPFFYHYVPTFNLFQAPARLMLWFVFALALLAGLGADRWAPPRQWALYWTRLGAMGAVSVILVGAFTYLALPATSKLAQQVHTVARAITWCGVGLLISALLSLLKPDAHAPRPPRSLTAWQVAVAVFLSADLLVAGFGLNPGAPPGLYRQPTASGLALREAIGAHRLFQFPDDEYQVKFNRYLSFQSFGSPEDASAMREALLPNVTLLDGLASANNSDPLLPARYTALVQVVSDTRSLNLLRLMDVAAIVSSAPLDLEPIRRGEATTVYRVPGEARRVWVVYSARTVADANAALAALADPSFDPAAEVILEADDRVASLWDREAPPLASAPPPRVHAKVVHGRDVPVERLPETPHRDVSTPRQPDVSYVHTPPHTSLTPSPNVVTITVLLERPGWVVLADTYYPGWFAYLDGRPAPLLRANYAFRAVAVEAGEHVVEFRYAPRSFQSGVWISLTSGLICLGLARHFLRRPP